MLEMAIAGTILLLIVGALTAALDGLRGVTITGSMDSKLQQAGERALKSIITDMKRSGAATVGAKTYPFLFDAGDASLDFSGAGAVPAGGWLMHSHAQATKQAQPGDPGFGPDREIVFLQPADVDGDGRPDVDANGNLVWDASDFSYVLISGAVDGRNYLQRRTNGGTPQTVASGVERIVFDDQASAGLQMSGIRVQIFLREVDDKGLVHRYQTQAIVGMRNMP